MATYSYNREQLQKRTNPDSLTDTLLMNRQKAEKAKKLRERNRKTLLAITIGTPLLALAILSASVHPTANVPHSHPTANVPHSQQQNLIVQKEYGYECTNPGSQTTLTTGDYKSCVEYVNSYQCSFDGSTFNTPSQSVCEKKVAEMLADDKKNFDPQQIADDYKQAADNIVADKWKDMSFGDRYQYLQDRRADN